MRYFRAATERTEQITERKGQEREVRRRQVSKARNSEKSTTGNTAKEDERAIGICSRYIDFEMLMRQMEYVQKTR